MDIKKILKSERNRLGMTQQEIADYLHLSQGSYAKYETGTNIPTTENISKLADLYNVSTDYLMGRKPPKTKPIDVVVASAIVYEFLFSLSLSDKKKFFEGRMPIIQFTESKQYKKLNPEQQRYLLQFYEGEQKELQNKNK